MIEQKFEPMNNTDHSFQVYFEIINQQRQPDSGNFLFNESQWLTESYRFKYFNRFFKETLKKNITRRIFHNGLTGISWFFKRFNRLTVKIYPLNKMRKILTTS